jgi:hypothetical protein
MAIRLDPPPPFAVPIDDVRMPVVTKTERYTEDTRIRYGLASATARVRRSETPSVAAPR